MTSGLWYQSFPTPFNVKELTFNSGHNITDHKSYDPRLSTDVISMPRYSQPSVQRPGSSCSIASNSSESTVIPPIHNKNYQESRYKTELCRHWQESGTCPHGTQCLFAHGLNELKPFRGRHRKYKTQLCKAFHSEGFCSFGPRCSYIHSSVLTVKELLPEQTSYHTNGYQNQSFVDNFK